MVMTQFLPHLLPWVDGIAGKSRRRRRAPVLLLPCRLPVAVLASCLHHSHRQAPLSIQELLLTMPLLDQISKVSTGLSSLGLEPKVPSPAPVPLSL